MMDQEYLTADEVAKIFRLKDSKTVKRWALMGKIRGMKIGKFWLFKPEWVANAKFLREGQS